MIGSSVLGGSVFSISDSMYFAALDVLIKIWKAYRLKIPIKRSLHYDLIIIHLVIDYVPGIYFKHYTRMIMNKSLFQ